MYFGFKQDLINEKRKKYTTQIFILLYIGNLIINSVIISRLSHLISRVIVGNNSLNISELMKNLNLFFHKIRCIVSNPKLKGYIYSKF